MWSIFLVYYTLVGGWTLWPTDRHPALRARARVVHGGLREETEYFNRRARRDGALLLSEGEAAPRLDIGVLRLRRRGCYTVTLFKKTFSLFSLFYSNFTSGSLFHLMHRRRGYERRPAEK